MFALNVPRVSLTSQNVELDVLARLDHTLRLLEEGWILAFDSFVDPIIVLEAV